MNIRSYTYTYLYYYLNLLDISILKSKSMIRMVFKDDFFHPAHH